jgi:hypothetical protein
MGAAEIVSMKIPVATFAGNLVEVRRVVWYAALTHSRGGRRCQRMCGHRADTARTSGTVGDDEARKLFGASARITRMRRLSNQARIGVCNTHQPKTTRHFLPVV